MKTSMLTSAALRLGGSLVSGSKNSAALVVLIFHRVLPEPDPLLPAEPDAKRFADQVKLLAESFNILRLRDAVHLLRSGQLPPRSLCITFDDGYANNCEVALPILKAHRAPATVFVAPGFLNGGRMFNDTIIEAVRRSGPVLDLQHLSLGRFALTDNAARIAAIEQIITGLKHLPPNTRSAAIDAVAQASGATLPNDLMMSDAQVKTLHRNGIEIGAHTMNHPILASAGDREARLEIQQSKVALEALLGAPVTTFAYPNGRPARDYAATHVQMVRECGFELALTTAWGAATRHSDPFQIPRVAPWDKTALRYGTRILRGYRQRQFATV